VHTLCVILLLAVAGPLPAQQITDTISIPLAPEFKKEWPYGILFGSHHQSLWTTPVTVERLNLSIYGGGLRAYREVVTPDNRLLLLATAERETVVFTPLRERFAEDEADPRDRHLIPVHPTSALVADELAGRAGLLRSNPRLVWLPDDSLLGEFRRSYRGSVGFMASTGPGGVASTVPFLDSGELFRALDADSRNRVDAKRYFLSRCVDLLTGDWHRSIWKWWWFAHQEGTRTVFRASPAIRRHSLLMLPPFPVAVHTALTPGFVNFSSELADVPRAVTTGAALDVRILTPMDRTTWDGITREFIAAMSDSALSAAVAKLPPPNRRTEGDTIIQMLRARRDTFASVSTRYYLTLAEFAEIRLSEAAERVSIERLPDGRVDVTAWQGGTSSPPVFHRLFEPDETKEIRLACLGGNDTVLVRGSAERSIVVRVNGGPGDDVLTDESTVQFNDRGFIAWFTSDDAATFFYDDRGSNRLSG
jgi:hypothetical protein